MDRNEKCSCGSGKKYKHCCMNKENEIKTNEIKTNEPVEPLENYPQSHVDVEIVTNNEKECFVVTIHGVKHYLHARTLQALTTISIAELFKWENQAHFRILGWDYTHPLLSKILEISEDDVTIYE